LAPDALDVAALAVRRRARVRQSLVRRNRSERIFRGLGLAACLVAVTFVGALFGNILSKGLPAFWQVQYTGEVHFDAQVINVGPRPVQAQGQSPANYRAELQRWQRQLAMVNWNRIILASVQGQLEGI